MNHKKKTKTSWSLLASSLLWAGAFAGCNAPGGTSLPVTNPAPGNKQVLISWTSNSTNQLGFRVEQSTDGSSFTPAAQVGAHTTSATISGLASGTQYFFRVVAFNSVGSSPASPIVAAKAP